MSILDIANQVVASINDELNDQAEELRSEISTVQGQVEEATSTVESQWTELSSKGESLGSAVQAAESNVSAAADQLRSKVEDSRSVIDAAMAQGQQINEATRAGIDSLDQGVTALIPDATEVLNKVDETIGALGEEMQSLDSALEDTRAFTDQHIHNEFNSLVETVKSESNDRCGVFGDYVSNDFITSMVSQVTDFKSAIDDVVDTANTKLDEVKTTAESQSGDIMDQVQQMFGDQFGQLIETVEQVQQFIEQVGDALVMAGQTVGTTTQVMSAGVGTTAIGVKSAIGIIEELTDLFNSVA